jgi:hypothetical protein
MSRVTVTAAAVGEGAAAVGDADVVGACVAGIDDGGVDAAADGDGSTLFDEHPPTTSAAMHSVTVERITVANQPGRISMPSRSDLPRCRDARPCACCS